MSTTTSHFQAMSREECQQRLAEHHAGRVAWTAADGPMVLPVSYQVYAGEVTFRTSAYGALSALIHPTNVAFEIDDIDMDAGTGWSVLVRGRAKAVRSPTVLTALWTLDGAVPWATGTRNVFIGIEPRSISGRLVKAPFAD